MTEDKLHKLLKDADRISPKPFFSHEKLTVTEIHHVRSKHIIMSAVPGIVVVVLLIALGIWKVTIPTDETIELQKAAKVDEQVIQLQARTDATINLIRQVLESERKKRRIDELEAKLAATPDALEEIQEQVDETAFILVYHADRMYNEYNLKSSAIKNYKRVIELFPENKWADVARQRISQLRKNSPKGDLLWERKNAYHS